MTRFFFIFCLLALIGTLCLRINAELAISQDQETYSFIDVTDSLATDITSPKQMEDVVINRFKQYLRINTAQPTPDYKAAVAFLREQGNRIGLSNVVKEFVEGRPTLILKWACEVDCDKSYRSVMLNSHMDVVPVVQKLWHTDAFGANEDKNGDIFARGSQDMKCVGMQYLEAIDQLKKKGFKPNRDIFVTFVPDEEIGGENGAKLLSESEYFRNTMRVGVTFDEGGPLNEGVGKFMAFYGERQVWWMRFHAKGEEGHASILLKEPATEKIARVIEKLFEFRRSQEREMQLNNKKLGEVVSINLTEMKGSKDGSLNVIPGDASIGVDVRVPPHTSKKLLREMFEKWAEASGCTLEIMYGGDVNSKNPITSTEGHWWKLFQKEMQSMGYKVEETIFQAATDARYIRDKGIACIGFSPIDNTPWLLHDHNEKLNRHVYLNGIKIYERLIEAFATTTGDDISDASS